MHAIYKRQWGSVCSHAIVLRRVCGLFKHVYSGMAFGPIVSCCAHALPDLGIAVRQQCGNEPRLLTGFGQ